MSKATTAAEARAGRKEALPARGPAYTVRLIRSEFSDRWGVYRGDELLASFHSGAAAKRDVEHRLALRAAFG